MIKGSDRKDISKVVQFRAPIEYSNMLDIISEILNNKISEVGSSEKITTTDIIKLSIESLATGRNTFNILGKEFSINELVNEELKYIKEDSFMELVVKAIKFEIKYYLIEIIREVIDSLHEILLSKKKVNYDISEEIKSLEGILFTRGEFFISKNLSVEEKEIFRTIEVYDLSYYLDIFKDMNGKDIFDLSKIDFQEMKNKVENIIFKYKNGRQITALKLMDNYQYSLLLTRIRKEIDNNIEYIKNYIKEYDDPFKEAADEYDRMMEDMYYSCDDYDDYDDGNYRCKSEFDLKPGDPGYEFSVAEALDNMYGK